MNKIKFAIKHFGYDILIFLGIVLFLVDSTIGESYSHENLAALGTAWMLVMVTWFRAAEHKSKSAPQTIHIHLIGNTTVEQVETAVRKAMRDANH